MTDTERKNLTLTSSQEAYDQIVAEKLLKKLHVDIYRVLLDFPDSTAGEVRAAVNRMYPDRKPRQINSISPRFRELERMGCLTVNPGQRKCRESGKSVVTYRLTTSLPNRSALKESAEKRAKHKLESKQIRNTADMAHSMLESVAKQLKDGLLPLIEHASNAGMLSANLPVVDVEHLRSLHQRIMHTIGFYELESGRKVRTEIPPAPAPAPQVQKPHQARTTA